MIMKEITIIPFFFILPNHFFRMEKQRKMILLKPKILVLPILMLYT